jgi:mRNA (guanine-N7-)-methyltransferase
MNKQNNTIKKQDVKESEPPNVALERIATALMNSTKQRYSELEMEAKFGTRGIKQLTKIDYDNVIKKLKSLGWVSYNETGDFLLRIQPEFLDAETGQFKTSKDSERFRVEIKGINSIQQYCSTNSIEQVNNKSHTDVVINKKMDYLILEKNNQIPVPSANFDDFNFRVTLKKEDTINKRGNAGISLFENWNRSKKVFRYMNRVAFVNDDYPFKVELSIVKSSKRNERGWLIPEFDITSSNVFNNPETYEIEIEALYDSVKLKYNTPNQIIGGLQKVVKHVLSGLQKTNFPISYTEMTKICQSYHKMLFEEEYKQKKGTYTPPRRLYPKDFIGPSLVTLDVTNIAPDTEGSLVPNIAEPGKYCVTEKADGLRCLLYVNETGRIYLITMNMDVVFTGAKTTEENCFNSLLDGELILHDKDKRYLNKYAAFDIYYYKNIDVRSRPFINTHSVNEKAFKDGCRLPMLKEFIRILKAVSIISTDKNPSQCPMIFTSKKFYPRFDGEKFEDTVENNIFIASERLLGFIGNGQFEYIIDGLIYTPTLLGVGSSRISEAGPKKKITWQHLFKWKPTISTPVFPKIYNTIDFLVLTKKSKDGQELVKPIFENGMDTENSSQFTQYKTLILCVGFDESRHGYINPCQDLLNDKFSKMEDNENEEGYKPKQFYPTEPFDAYAGICCIKLKKDTTGNYKMFTEEGEVFEDQTVVEFSYDMDELDPKWRWKPLRIRYDKTADFKSGYGVGANDYSTANNNWRSIHRPITEEMLKTGKGIPAIEVSDDIYYNGSSNDRLTQPMRDFHNLYVKKSLILGTSKKGNILIDFACGKAGDLPKWIAAELSFVFGIDISKDNIENRINGACARYLNMRKTTKRMPHALFVHGNSSLNIRSGTNMFDAKSNDITRAIFGLSKDPDLGPAVDRQKNRGINGFDIASCQFALHYMFENKDTFYNFIRNVAECTKINGYFIGTCYDGDTIFRLLRKKQEGGSDEIYIQSKKIWSVTKLYDAKTFESDSTSLGYKIDVYQDSINQTLPEYLVNFEFLKKTMHMYGFELIDKNEARMMHLPNGSGMFNELFDAMEYEVRRNNDKSADYKDALRMANYEKDISFLNRYFVFKKIQTRNVEQLTKMIMNSSLGEEIIEEEATEKAKEAIEEPKTKKLNEEIILEEEEKGKDIEILADIVKSKKRKTAKKPSINVQQIEIKEGADNDEEEAEIIINYDVKKKSKKTSTRKKKDNP